MRRATAITVLAAVGCLLVSGCARPTVHNTGVMYTCCANDVVSTRWQPGQQLRVVWTRTGRLAPGRPPAALTLSAVLFGPFSKVTALKNAIRTGRDHAAVRFAAPQLRISRNPPRSPVSVIAIPADAPPGFYDLQIRVVFTGGSVSGDSIVTVG
jgi:hypothetical protein